MRLLFGVTSAGVVIGFVVVVAGFEAGLAVVLLMMVAATCFRIESQFTCRSAVLTAFGEEVFAIVGGGFAAGVTGGGSGDEEKKASVLAWFAA